MTRHIAPGSGQHQITIGEHEYATVAGLIAEYLGDRANWGWIIRDWTRRGLLDSGDKDAPAVVKMGRTCWYRVDVILAVERSTRHRGRRRAQRTSELDQGVVADA